MTWIGGLLFVESDESEKETRPVLDELDEFGELDELDELDELSEDDVSIRICLSKSILNRPA